MSSLTCIFDECRKQPDGETLEQLRANYFTDIVMNERESTSVGVINIPQAGAIVAINEKKEREKHAKYIATALKLLNDRLDALEAQLARIEDELIRNHGEDFATHLAIDHLDDETYKHIMAIQNDEDRRQEFAKALNEGLEDGTIEKDAFDDNPEFKKWLDVRNEKEEYLMEVDQNTNNLELANSISTEQKINNAHAISDGNEEDAFNSIFANKNSI